MIKQTFALLVLAVPLPVKATTCADPPFCARISGKSILFTGVVRSNETIDAVSGLGRAQVDIRRVFLGLPIETKEIGILTFGKFEPGQTYLFDVGRGQDGSLMTLICDSTDRIENNTEFIKFLEARERGNGQTTLTLSVRSAEQPVSDAEVVVVGRDSTVRGRTNTKGIVKFAGLSGGTYTASARKVHFMLVQNGYGRQIELLPLTCGDIEVKLESLSSVSGIFKLQDGSPAVGIGVRLVALGERRSSYDSLTQPDGSFSFHGVNPGEYHLGTSIGYQKSVAPRSFYPGTTEANDAIPIRVQPGKSINNLHYLLPDFGPWRVIRIRVLDEKGQAFSAVRINSICINEERSDQYGSLGTDLRPASDGTLTLRGFEKARYCVSAFGALLRKEKGYFVLTKT